MAADVDPCCARRERPLRPQPDALAYRNPGAPSAARWINDDWAEKDVPGLMAPELGAQGLKDHTY